MAQYGVDIHARYQSGISLPRLKAEGYSFVVTKASQGLSVPSDAALSAAAFKAHVMAWMAETRQLGMIPGLYHWLTAGDGAAQARFFHQLVVAAGGPQGMLIQLDNEDNASWTTTQDWAREWARLTAGHPWLMYTGAWWWGPRGWPGATLTPLLWHSHYLTADADTISDNPATFASRIPADWWRPGYGGWPEATLLQFTSRGDAGSLGNNVDLNVYRGDREQLLALTRPAARTTTIEEDTMAAPKFIVIAEAGAESVCITGGGPTLGYRHVAKWAEVQDLAGEWQLRATEADVKAWIRMTRERADSLYGPPRSAGGGGLSFAEAVEAARLGAEQAEDS